MRGAISIKSVKKPMDMETKANDESDMEKTLDSPLLSEDHSIWMGAKPKVYADVRPKILLEVISKRTTTVVLSLTYISFFICFIIDMLNTRIAFTSSNFKFEPLSCIQHSNGPKVTSTISPTIVTQSPTPLMEPTHSEESQACRNDQSYSWNGTVNGLNNVISTQLSVTQTNFSSLSNWSTIDSSNICQFVSVQFDVTLWACYESYGCGNSFSGAGGNNDLHTWHQVIALNSQTATFDSCALSSESSAVLSLLPNTFQNQESIPSNGAVKSYLVQVSFYDNPFQLFIPVNAVAAQSIEYSFEVVQRPTHGAGSSIATAILIVCIVLVLLCSVGYVWIMLETEPDPRLWLPEQQWIVCNLIFVIFYLNPVYCSIFWYSDSSPATASAVYTSYLFDSFGQCGFFAVWLFFADAVSVRSIHATKFYLPKIAFVLSLFICSVVILTLQFPSILPASISARNPVEAVPSWPAELQTVFASFSLTFLVLQWTWAVIWFVYLYLTGSKLSKLPYMSTRYLQLSFRFFNLQAVLLTVYYIAQYSTAAYYIATNDDSEDLPTYSQLADDINTLFREQTQLFGKLVFLTVYTLTLTFLFLPASIALDGESSLADKLADTYVISEAELKTIVRSRRQAIYRLNQMQQSLLENVSSYKPFVFCVDLAISLCNCSLEVYLDPAESGTVVERNAQGEHSQLDLEALGYQMLEFKVDDTHDTVCCIARHNTTRRLLVLFR